jgi:DNA-binding NarL/FixJ family response regulator
VPGRFRILFVDDEVRVLDALRRSLRRQEPRWDMTFITDPAEAVEAFRRQPADVVVTDMKMPGLNGIKMVSAMRRTGHSAAYLVLTGTADLRTAIDAINKAEIFRFFTKPCPAFLLVEGIEAALASQAPRVQTAPELGVIGETALDQLVVSVLVVDAEARVLFMNRRGGALCAAADGIILGARKVCRASVPAETARLHALIVSAIREGEGGVMSLTRAEAGPLSVAVTALEAGGAKAALYISDPDDRPIPSPDQLSGLLDLTLAEARLAHGLALGQSLEEAALASGITIGTARGYLKQVFSKTGRSRQAELVRLIMSLPVTLPNGSVGPMAKA